MGWGVYDDEDNNDYSCGYSPGTHNSTVINTVALVCSGWRHYYYYYYYYCYYYYCCCCYYYYYYCCCCCCYYYYYYYYY